MRLQDKVTVITGAGSGMGLAIAKRFALEGAKVVAGDWHAERLETAVESIRKSGGTIAGGQGNIADRAVAEALVDLAISLHGRIDVLVNNAGVMDYRQGVGELSDDTWRRVLGVNMDGPMFTMRRAVPHMVKQEGGSIVNVASTAGIRGGTAGAALRGLQARLGRADSKHSMAVCCPARPLQRDLSGPDPDQHPRVDVRGTF